MTVDDDRMHQHHANVSFFFVDHFIYAMLYFHFKSVWFHPRGKREDFLCDSVAAVKSGIESRDFLCGWFTIYRLIGDLFSCERWHQFIGFETNRTIDLRLRSLRMIAFWKTLQSPHCCGWHRKDRSQMLKQVRQVHFTCSLALKTAFWSIFFRLQSMQSFLVTAAVVRRLCIVDIVEAVSSFWSEMR